VAFRPGHDPSLRPGPSSRVLAVADSKVAEGVAVGGEPLHVGWIDDAPVFAARPTDGLPEDARGLRAVLAEGPEDFALAAGRAAQLLDWETTHAFCGRCGTASERSSAELTRVCPNCGLVTYPRISPAVIMAVRRGDEVLLARRAGLSLFWSVLAGFVDPGESLEQAVVREVEEEVGLQVDALEYVGSQPWPFPSQLMIGFRARYAGGELRIDETELAEAGWFRLDALPEIPPPYTIANRLILGR